MGSKLARRTLGALLLFAAAGGCGGGSNRGDGRPPPSGSETRTGSYQIDVSGSIGLVTSADGYTPTAGQLLRLAVP